MARKLFVNLAVADLDRSVEFFTRLGFTFDPRFTDETATSMIVGEDAYVMLLVEDRFKDFAKKELADATAQTLPRFAGRPGVDPRAPQNLTPVGALEARLRHRLGSSSFLSRSLQAHLAEEFAHD